MTYAYLDTINIYHKNSYIVATIVMLIMLVTDLHMCAPATANDVAITRQPK